MPFSKGSRIGPLLVAAIVIVLLNTWFAVASVRTLSQSEYWLSHTWQVIGQVEGIVASVRDADSSASGFVLTGDTNRLTSYYLARQQVTPQIQRFRELTSDNPRQRDNADRLEHIAAERLALLDQVIAAKKIGGTEAAASLLTEDASSARPRVRPIAESMQDEERRLLTIREEDVKRSTLVALLSVAVASGLDLLLIVFVGRILVREREMRMQTQTANRELEMAHAEVEKNVETIRQLNTELEERVRSRTMELESTNRELEAFSYSVSHDLRAPLRTIDGFSLALQEDYEEAVDETGRDYIRRVRSGVQRMGGLIDALLQLSRITRAELSRREVDVTALAESVAENLKEEHPEQQIHFDIDPGMHANADPDLLRVAFENLMGNAVKFSSKVSVSVIRVSYDPEKKRFEVADNGAGFDMQYSSKLFNAFNRLHGDKDFKGSGIGLATVARVIHRHHGTISAESSVGNGARFFFTLG
ncbi:sensor histidine kinase [Terriglobus aquaticus]|uniref:histidine kinase n=1 Tax=Terriglobus aquaticus TaxID=940139 RepID=A0ABW9KLI2_9BACT|nr:sensor histidine kinase [Terriglobus aquaticus]